jgi:hypothetical protein
MNKTDVEVSSLGMNICKEKKMSRSITYVGTLIFECEKEKRRTRKTKKKQMNRFRDAIESIVLNKA